MIDATKKPAFYAVTTGILGITACTMIMNAKFGYSQGHDDLEKWLFVVAGVGMDLVKVFGLGFIVTAAIKKSYFKALSGGAIWAMCVAYGLWCASGFAVTGRTYNIAEATFSNDQLKTVKREYESQLADLNRMKEQLDTMKGNERYKSTAGCSVPEDRMRTDSRFFCTDFATQKEKVSKKEVEVYLAKQKVPTDEYAKPADPQMSFWADALNLPMNKMLQYWAIVLAIGFEMVSAFGMFAISPTRRKPVRTASGEVIIPEDDDTAETETPVRRGPGRPKGSKNKPKLVVVAGENVSGTRAA